MAEKPAGWPKGLDYTEDMAGYIDKLADLENSIKMGYNEKLDSVGDLGPLPLGSNDPSQDTVRVGDDKFYEYLSLEGGSNTIGYGHKIKEGEDFSKGISISEAKELLIKDTLDAYRRAYNSYKNRYSKGEANKWGEDEWNKLSDKSKVALTELSFNIGNTKAYEKAFHDKDKKEVTRLIRERGYTGTKGEVNTLGPRNEQIIRDYITPDDWSEETSYIEQWNKEDNIFA